MWQTLIGPVVDLISEVVTDKDQANKLAHEIATLAEKQAHEVALAQIEVNKLEARGNWFQSSWRPLIGWTCGIAFMWHFVLSPMTIFVLAYLDVDVPYLPEFDMASLLTVLGGMLGLGGMRSWERIKGVGK